MLHILGVLAGVLALLAAIPYIRDIIRGRTKPNRVSWFIWVLLQAIALLSQLAEGGRDSVLLSGGDLIASAIILVLAFYKGESKWHWIDKAALLGAAVGLSIWYFFNQPVLALLITVFIDFCGVVPTLRKAYAEPYSETLSTWLIVGVGGVCSILAVGKFDRSLLLYPVYLTLANFGVAAAIQLGKAHRVRGRIA